MIEKYTEKMQKSVDNLESEYNSIRAGRANPHVLDRIKVDYYGTPTPLSAGRQHHSAGTAYHLYPAVGDFSS